MAVAKSYEKMPQTCEPYEINGKMYVKVNTGKTEKQVRWYSDKEYAKMYPEAIKVTQNRQDPHFRTQKDVLGFKNGYITIFKGDTYSQIEWFRASICRYTRWWGWYVTSEEEVPEDLPEGITPVKLDWEPMSEDGENLIGNESKIKEYVESVQFDPMPSEFIGNIKDRLDLILTVVKTHELENNYGRSTIHTFKDENDNIFIWITAAKTLEVGKTYKMRGTVKDHKVFRNTKQTVLTRCSNIEEVEIND